MVKFDQLTTELGPHLHKRLQTEYAYNEGNFRHLFDDLQVSSAAAAAVILKSPTPRSLGLCRKKRPTQLGAFIIKT